MNEHEKYGPQYVADECGISVRTARRLMKEGRIRSMRISTSGQRVHLRTLPGYVAKFKQTAFITRDEQPATHPSITRTTSNVVSATKPSGIVVADTLYRSAAKRQTTTFTNRSQS
jgi:hypothetical protein